MQQSPANLIQVKAKIQEGEKIPLRASLPAHRSARERPAVLTAQQQDQLKIFGRVLGTRISANRRSTFINRIQIASISKGPAPKSPGLSFWSILRRQLVDDRVKTIRTESRTTYETQSDMVSAVIFDLDGLLADTECLHCRAYQMALQEHGVQLEDREYAEHWVRFGKGIADWLTIRGLALDPHAFVCARQSTIWTCWPRRYGRWTAHWSSLTFLSGRTKIALASSSYRDAIDGVLAGLGIAPLFRSHRQRPRRRAGKTGAGHLSQGGERSQRRALANAWSWKTPRRASSRRISPACAALRFRTTTRAITISRRRR